MQTKKQESCKHLQSVAYPCISTTCKPLLPPQSPAILAKPSKPLQTPTNEFAPPIPAQARILKASFCVHRANQ